MKNQRKTLFHVNRFQKTLFYPVIFAFCIGCCVAWLSIVYALIGNYLSAPDLYRFQDLIPGLLSVATGLMFLLIFWTLRITSRYLGAYERIINELDEVLSGGRKERLLTRQGDVIFEDLLKRINALIEKTQ